MTYYYEAFSATNAEQRKKAEKEIGHYLTRGLGLEAVLRVRASSGLVMSTFHGHFFVRSVDLLALPNVSPDNAYTLQVTYEHDLPENQQFAYFQVALLYTSSTGERRIRVHTLALPTATNLGEVFASADAQAVASVLAKMAIDRALSSRLTDAREAMINLVADCLKSYRELMGGGADRGLMAPNSLRLLPLYVLGLLKNPAFTTEQGVAIDSRANAMTMIKVLPLWELKEYMYPRLYALHNLPEDVGLRDEQNRLPMPIVLHASASMIERGGVYLLSNSQYILLYVSRDVSPQHCTDLFGCAYSELKCGPTDLPRADSTVSKKVRNIVRGLRSCHPRYLVLVLITEDSKLRQIFMQHLVDDKIGGQMSYYELLQDIQKRAS
jgi:protein transport protein SEC24